MIKSKLVSKIAVLAVATVGLAGAALAEYPDRPVSFVVPFPPGDLEDCLTSALVGQI